MKYFKRASLTAFKYTDRQRHDFGRDNVEELLPIPATAFIPCSRKRLS